jgi:hypothetical protein
VLIQVPKLEVSELELMDIAHVAGHCVTVVKTVFTDRGAQVACVMVIVLLERWLETVEPGLGIKDPETAGEVMVPSKELNATMEDIDAESGTPADLEESDIDASDDMLVAAKMLEIAIPELMARMPSYTMLMLAICKVGNVGTCPSIVLSHLSSKVIAVLGSSGNTGIDENSWNSANKSAMSIVRTSFPP